MLAKSGFVPTATCVVAYACMQSLKHQVKRRASSDLAILFSTTKASTAGGGRRAALAQAEAEMVPEVPGWFACELTEDMRCKQCVDEMSNEEGALRCEQCE